MDNSFLPELKDLLFGQQLGVLATDLGDYPYSSLVGYAITEDLRWIYFATPRASRKYANLQRRPKASLLIDSRTHNPDDFYQAAAVTVLGTVGECTPAHLAPVRKLFLRRHPQLRDFVMEDTCAMMVLAVDRYLFVRNFQDVVEWRPGADKENT